MLSLIRVVTLSLVRHPFIIPQHQFVLMAMGSFGRGVIRIVMAIGRGVIHIVIGIGSHILQIVMGAGRHIIRIVVDIGIQIVQTVIGIRTDIIEIAKCIRGVRKSGLVSVGGVEVLRRRSW
jgi:hypothetical protein